MADEITDAEIAELRRLHEAATPGPWGVETDVCDCGGGYPCVHGEYVYAINRPDGTRMGSELSELEEADARVMVAARNALSGLLARLERVERERDEAIENARVASHDRRELMELTSAKKYGFGRGEALEARIATLEAALRPFTHPDLMPILGGQCEGDQSPVYQRGDALLILGHFRAARAALRGVEGK